MTTPAKPVFVQGNPLTGALPEITERRFAKPADLTPLAKTVALEDLADEVATKASQQDVDGALLQKADADDVASALAAKVGLFGSTPMAIATYQSTTAPTITTPAIAAMPENTLVVWTGP